MARTAIRHARILSAVTGVLLVAGVLSAVPALAPAQAMPHAAAAAAATDARLGELVGRRTRTSMTIRQADGSLKTVLSAGAVHYQDSTGAWKRIDNTLIDSMDAGYAYRNKANSFRASFKAALGGEHLQVSTAGRNFGLQL